MTTVILNTKQFCPHKGTVKMLCSHSLGFYKEIQRNVSIKGYLAILQCPEDNGRYEDEHGQ